MTMPPLVKKGFYMCCAVCGLEQRYCKGHAPVPSPQPKDGDISSLEARVRAVKGAL